MLNTKPLKKRKQNENNKNYETMLDRSLGVPEETIENLLMRDLFISGLVALGVLKRDIPNTPASEPGI